MNDATLSDLCNDPGMSVSQESRLALALANAALAAGDTVNVYVFAGWLYRQGYATTMDVRIAGKAMNEAAPALAALARRERTLLDVRRFKDGAALTWRQVAILAEERLESWR